MSTKLIAKAKQSFIGDGLSKKEQKTYLKAIKNTLKLRKRFSKIVKHLRNAKNEYAIIKWFGKAYHLTQYIDVNVVGYKFLHKYHINDDEDLLNSYQYVLDVLDEAFVASDNPKKAQTRILKSIGLSSLDDLYDNFDLVRTYRLLGFQWFVLNTHNNVIPLDKSTAVEAVNGLAQHASIIPN